MFDPINKSNRRASRKCWAQFPFISDLKVLNYSKTETKYEFINRLFSRGAQGARTALK